MSSWKAFGPKIDAITHNVFLDPTCTYWICLSGSMSRQEPEEGSRSSVTDNAHYCVHVKVLCLESNRSTYDVDLGIQRRMVTPDNSGSLRTAISGPNFTFFLALNLFIYSFFSYSFF